MLGGLNASKMRVGSSIVYNSNGSCIVSYIYTLPYRYKVRSVCVVYNQFNSSVYTLLYEKGKFQWELSLSPHIYTHVWGPMGVLGLDCLD